MRGKFILLSPTLSSRRGSKMALQLIYLEYKKVV
jgi:hypothetical protein